MSIKDKERDALERAVSGGLRAAINDHGAITPDQIGSAAKRVAGSLRNASAAELTKKLKPGESRRVPIAVIVYRCTRCNEQSVTMPDPLEAEPQPPKRCANCRSPYWMDKPGVRPMGRPRKGPPSTKPTS